jgi:hypothetical protein
MSPRMGLDFFEKNIIAPFVGNGTKFFGPVAR